MTTLTLADARRLWDDILSDNKLETEYVAPDQAYGRIAAADVCAAMPYPPYRKSPFDGYALRIQPNASAYVVIATIGAGEIYDGAVAPGQAVRLMTGCAVPADCNAVVMQEQTQRDGDRLFVTTSPAVGDNIIPVGEECRSGEVVIPKGTRWTSGAVSVAAAISDGNPLPVYKDIRVVFLTSGRELVLPGEKRHYGQIYNSNAYLFRRLLAEEGIQSIVFRHVSDDPALLSSETNAVAALAAEADIIISTGGVSVGLYDTMPLLYESLGACELYRRIAMRPGSASYGAVLRPKGRNIVPIVALSGNPSASFNAFYLVALPVIRKLRGEQYGDFPVVACRISTNFNKNNPVDRFIQGVVFTENGRLCFTPNQVVKSSALLGLRRTNGLAMIPKGAPSLQKGGDVSVLLLRRL